jgi:SAM-dependent methyltransferase
MDLASLAPGLVEEQPGLWVASAVDDVSYPEGGHARCHQVEESSFWFRHRSRCILATLRRLPPGGPLFDIGGGNGMLASHLGEAGFASVVVEPGESGAATAYGRGLRPVVNASLDRAGFLPGTLPAAGMFDVLEHLEDDAGFLARLRSLLPSGGRLYLTVPAYRWLWSVDDVRAGHFRRYTEASLRHVLIRSGFGVEYASYIFRPLPVPVLAARSVPSRLGLRKVESTDAAAADHRPDRGLLGRALEAALDREIPVVARGGRMRFGTSILAVAVNPGDRTGAAWLSASPEPS